MGYLNSYDDFIESTDLKAAEQVVIREFLCQNTVPLYVPKYGINESNWYLLMQLRHIECPTRLIDWSVDFTRGLYFATEDFDIDGALFLTPAQFNQCQADELEDHDPFSLKSPLMVTQINNGSLGDRYPAMQNMYRQRGKFFITPYESCLIPMEELPNYDQFIIKITITPKAKQDIRANIPIDQAYIYSH